MSRIQQVRRHSVDFMALNVSGLIASLDLIDEAESTRRTVAKLILSRKAVNSWPLA